MGGNKRRLIVDQLLALLGMCIGLVVYRYADTAGLDLPTEIVAVIGAVMVFLCGFAANVALRQIMQPTLRVDEGMAHVGGLPHVTLANPQGFEFIEVKVSFELAERTSEPGKPFAGRVVRAATESFASVPPGRWRNPARLQIPIPEKVRDAWREEPSSRVTLYVRATSVHPTTNHRAVTNTVEFSRTRALADEAQKTPALADGTGRITPNAAGAERAPA